MHIETNQTHDILNIKSGTLCNKIIKQIDFKKILNTNVGEITNKRRFEKINFSCSRKLVN